MAELRDPTHPINILDIITISRIIRCLIMVVFSYFAMSIYDKHLKKIGVEKDWKVFMPIVILIVYASYILTRF